MATLRTLYDLSDSIWALLQHASADRNSAMRWPTLATVDTGGHPQARTIVLRGVDIPKRTLFAYTDTRSEKVGQLTTKSSAQLHFFDPQEMQQIRIETDTMLHTSGKLWEHHWSAISERAKLDYATISRPGQTGDIGHDLAQAKDNFCVLEFHALRADWLTLERSGHTRAKLIWDENEVTGDWVTP